MAEAQEHTLASGIFHRFWAADGVPRGAALIVHGLGEHSGRYDHVAAALAARGIAVYAPDHPGHGRSPGHRCHVAAFDEFFGPLDELRNLIEADCHGVPCFLIGHSMGGLIAGEYLLARQHRFDGAVFSGAAFEVPEAPGPVALFINRLIAAVLPKFGVLQLDASEVSRDAEVVRRYREDPLVHGGKISARLVVELFAAMEDLAAKRSAIALPVLVLHGEADVMTPAAGSRRFFEGVGSADKTLRMYPGLYHEIFNEPERALVIGEVCDWLDARIRGA